MKLDAIHEQMSESEASDPPPGELHLLDVLIVLSRRRRFVVAFTLGAALLAGIFVLVVPSKYTATTTVMPPQQNASMSSALLGQLSGSNALASVAGAGLGLKNPSDMYVSLFHSRTIEDSMVQRFGLIDRYKTKKESDARTALEDHTTVALGAKDGLIRIAATDRDPKEAADIANGYVDEFKKLSATLAISEASRRRIFFEQQLLEAKENLTTAEETLKHTEQSTGVLQIDSQARSLIESAANLRAQVVAKEVQLQGMRSYATEDNPDVVTAEQQLAALKAQLAKLAGTDQDSGSDFIVPKGKVPEAGMEYLRRLRDVKYYETISELIAKQFEIAKLDEARQGSIIQVVDVAVPPDKRSFPRRTLTVVAAALLAFFGASFWVIFRSMWNDVKQQPQIRSRLQVLSGKQVEEVRQEISS
jgi:tyrosine-protein kinase Etk/Wzc